MGKRGIMCRMPFVCASPLRVITSVTPPLLPSHPPSSLFGNHTVSHSFRRVLNIWNIWSRLAKGRDNPFQWLHRSPDGTSQLQNLGIRHEVPLLVFSSALSGGQVPSADPWVGHRIFYFNIDAASVGPAFAAYEWVCTLLL
jgi:hypothetical protein